MNPYTIGLSVLIAFGLVGTHRVIRCEDLKLAQDNRRKEIVISKLDTCTDDECNREVMAIAKYLIQFDAEVLQAEGCR